MMPREILNYLRRGFLHPAVKKNHRVKGHTPCPESSPCWSSLGRDPGLGLCEKIRVGWPVITQYKHSVTTTMPDLVVDCVQIFLEKHIAHNSLQLEVQQYPSLPNAVSFQNSL